MTYVFEWCYNRLFGTVSAALEVQTLESDVPIYLLLIKWNTLCS